MNLAKELVRRGHGKIAHIARALKVSRSNLYQNPTPRPRHYSRREDGEVRDEILELLKRRETCGKVMTIASNVRRCTDIMQINCWSGKRVFIAFALDCHDREVMAYVAYDRPLTHRDIIELIDRAIVHRFGDWADRLKKPIQWLSDQGPQYIAHETRDYARQWGLEPITTPSYSPESNGMAKSFVKTIKRDYVYVSDLWTAESVLRQVPEWFDDYNKNHPHSALRFMSPREYREKACSGEKVFV